MEMNWYLWIDDQPRRGWLNMAIDAALLDLAELDGVGFLRVYRWAPPCLSFGRHEPAARRYRRERIEQLGLDVVRRPSGGRAVWHEAELTYAVAAPAGVLGTLSESHRAIHGTLAQALERIGAEPALAPAGRPSSPADGPCFDVAAGGEILAGGRKLAGSAQLRTQHAFLQHGSIILDSRQGILATLSATPSAASQATSLSAVLSRPVAFAELAEHIADAACAAWPGHWHPISTGAVILERAAAFADTFRSPAWTWSR
jgi:lipoate-protein ligase A